MVRRRLRSHAILEAINIPLIGWGAQLCFPISAANLVGFGCLAMLLVVGTAYWRAKIAQLDAGRCHPPGIAWFARARSFSVVVLTAASWFIVWRVIEQPGASTWPGLGLVMFSWLEYINYFHVQLSHQSRADRVRLRRHGLRRSHLSRDLASFRRTTPTPTGSPSSDSRVPRG